MSDAWYSVCLCHGKILLVYPISIMLGEPRSFAVCFFPHQPSFCLTTTFFVNHAPLSPSLSIHCTRFKSCTIQNHDRDIKQVPNSSFLDSNRLLPFACSGFLFCSLSKRPVLSQEDIHCLRCSNQVNWRLQLLAEDCTTSTFGEGDNILG